MSEMEKNINKLNDDELDGVAGGVIFNASGIIGADKDNPWEVLDDRNGNTLGRFKSRDEALAAAGRLGQNHMEVNWDQVLQLRGQK
ncbi:MAG: hypothetical protein J5959_11970 [Butyrivibrio sp.]|nr:hypothetical protein [Butyrivibrio sp.]MBO6112081.1 hypothetical protein [Lachnospiraceae bacterium]